MSEFEAAVDPLASYVKTPIPWVNGDVVSVLDLTDFKKLEDGLTDHIPHKERHVAMWEGRKDIGEILRPKKFFGRIAQIELVFTDAPKEFIQQNFLHLKNSTTGISLSDTDEHIRSYMFGFEFFAGLFSTGKGRIGTLNTFVAYAPPTKHKDPDNFFFNGHIRRVVAKPSVITNIPLSKLRQNSINNALKLREHAARHPYSGAIETNRNT